jgi:hypothetical protein
VLFAPGDHLLEDGLVNLAKKCQCIALGGMGGRAMSHVGDGNGLAGVTKILEHVLDEDGALSDGAVC